MLVESVYKKGMRVWVRHPNKVWESAIILEDYGADQNKLFIHTDDTRQTQILNITSPSELPPLHLSEDSSLDIESNLSSLLVIHEATILHKLRSRFEQRYSYSYCGISTIALNPYFRLSENENEKISSYRNSTLRNLDPHIFGVVENVYTKLERDNCDQTLVFTGESGAGKSVNAERAILYLTTTSSKEDQVKGKILASSLILQAFGHASTEINRDASRFGKFLQMQYDKYYHVIGALLTTYNFDRSNIVSQELHRKAFHIFYYMYASKEKLSHLHLNECQYDYLKKKTEVKAYNAHNKKYFNKIIEAFNVLEFSEKEQNEILKILAVILHLQSLAFQKVDGMNINKSSESCTIADQNQLKTIGKVLGLDEQALKIMRKWMCYKRTFCAQDEILQPMNLEQVMKARNSLAKFVYTKLFGWLVTRMNTSFRSPCHVQSFIGILDVHGFEKLESNSFEQFCINYIDEKLEQSFIRINFKLEQEEYEREQIGWTFIGFSDNMGNVELIEGKCGILDLLEEETKLSSENILPWLENLRTKFEKCSNFEISTDIADFTIRHFIYPVKYNAIDFLAKNYETVAKEQLEALKESKNELLNKLITDELLKINISKVKKTLGVRKRASFSSKLSRKTVTSELRTSLAVLVGTLSKTKATFVRCIKSNDEKKAFTFNSQRVAEQLHAYNIVETAKISAAGYFQQRCFKEFALRYHCLSQFEDVKSEDKQKVCQKTLALYEKNDDVKFGKTKVFLRQDTVDYLENLRSEKRQHAAIVIQKSTRRFLHQKCYNEVRRAICGFQPYARGYLVRQWVQSVRDRTDLEHLAATKIQAWFRGFLQHRWYQYIKQKAPVPQAYANQVEPNLDRFYTKDMAATEIQRHVKSFLVRRNYARTIKNIIIVQSLVRRFLAMLKLKKLKARNDLRSTVLNKSVEKNLDSLQKRIDCLMSMHLSTEDLASVQSIMDPQTCTQAKNRILNDLLFRKIKTLQDLRTNQKPCEVPQTQRTQFASENCCADERCGINWRMYDKPLVEEYDNEALYQKLIDSFRKVERDAKILQQSAGIRDEEILRLMASYRNSIKAVKVAEVPLVEVVQKVDSKNTEVHKERIQIKVDHCTDSFQSSGQLVRIPDLSLDTEDLQDSYARAKANYQRKAEELYDLDEECKQRFSKKACGLSMLSNGNGLSEETPSVDEKLHDLTRHYSSPKSSNQQTSVALFSKRLYLDGKLKQKLKENKKFRLIMYGDENEFEENSNDDTGYHGMFEFELKATESVIHHITDVGPSIFIDYDQSPDLPVQILLMCVRYADHKNDYLAALSLLCNFIKRVKVIVETSELFHIGVFWLLNTHRLLNYLKQYSKPDDKNQQLHQYHAKNTVRQNQHRLKHIDLRDTWITLEQTCKLLANWIVREIKSCNLALHVVASLLCTEEMYDLNVEPGVKGASRRIDILLNELTNYHETLIKYGIDRQVIIQIFKLIFDYIGFISLGNILSRSDLCSVSKGIHIRSNLRILECWALNRQLSTAIQGLDSFTQAVRLIQLQPISQDDIPNIRENYNKLNCDQILKIVNSYNDHCNSTRPASYHQVSVPLLVIDQLKKTIEQRHDLDDTVIVDAEERPKEYQIQFPFRHSRVKLEQVEIPQRFYLPMLKKI